MNTDQPGGLRTDGETPLSSWKEIGAYLQRNSATARRWEKEEGLPVHRHSHKSRSSVYAYPSEIDAWRAGRKVAPEPAPARPLWKIPAFALTMTLCLVMGGNGVRPQVAAAQSGQRARQVWVGTGGEVDTHGTVSNDGRFLSFVDQTTGDLAIRSLDTGENRRLTDNGNTDWAAFAVDSCVSVDGRQVAYVWSSREGADLRVIPATGGKAAPRVIYRNKDVTVQPFGWLPDGSGVFGYLSRPDQTHQIALIRSDGSGATILKSFDWRFSNKLSVSPDGRYVAYDFPPNEDNPEHDIYILAADGSHEVRAVQNPADDLMVGWSSDGKALLFASDRTGTLGLWSIAVAGGNPKGQPALLKKDIGRITPLGLSSHGTLYYGMETGIRDVYTVAIDPKTLKPVSEPVLAAQRFLGTNSGADWSPDRKYLAYTSRHGAALRSPSVLTIHSLADGTERDVMTKLAYVFDYQGIRWSPDGGSIFMRGLDRKGQDGLYKVNVQTGETVAVARGVMRVPVWSRDRRTMYSLRAFDGPAKIIALDTRDNAEREVYQSPGLGFGHITISPDGKNLAFVEGPTEHAKVMHILVLPTDGGKPRILVEAPSIYNFVLLEWTPDGESLLFAKPGLELWRVNVRSGEQSLVSRYSPEQALRAGRISPDGRQFAYTFGGRTSEIWALENFLPQSKGK